MVKALLVFDNLPDQEASEATYKKVCKHCKHRQNKFCCRDGGRCREYYKELEQQRRQCEEAERVLDKGW